MATLACRRDDQGGRYLGKMKRRDTCLASLAIGRDEGCVSGGGGLGAISNHALIHFQCMLWLTTPVAGVDDGVVRPYLRLCSLHSCGFEQS